MEKIKAITYVRACARVNVKKLRGKDNHEAVAGNKNYVWKCDGMELFGTFTTVIRVHNTLTYHRDTIMYNVQCTDVYEYMTQSMIPP